MMKKLEVVRALLSDDQNTSDSAMNRLSNTENLLMSFLDSNQNKSFFGKHSSFGKENLYTHDENFGKYSLASTV